MSKRLMENQFTERKGKSANNLSLPLSVQTTGFMGNVVSTPWREIESSVISNMI